jgi:hypothetical protein
MNFGLGSGRESQHGLQPAATSGYAAAFGRQPCRVRLLAPWWKVAGLILLALTANAAVAQTNQGWSVCRDHLRIFGSDSVDLTPLFQWWERQPAPGKGTIYGTADLDASNAAPDEERPLMAWHHIVGTHVATRGASWVVDAYIYTAPTNRTSARILLNRPPDGEEQRYYSLRQQLALLDQQITNAGQASKADLQAEQQDRQRVQADIRTHHNRFTEANRADVAAYTQDATQQHQAATNAAALQKQWTAMRGPIEQQLKAIPSQNGAYLVDWFAVMLGRDKKGLPIYDLGVVSPSPP